MKKVVYLKVSNKTNQVKASYHKNYMPLMKPNTYGNDKYYPTITIKLNLEIPDDFFTKAQKEIDLKISELNICDEIEIKELEEGK